MDLSKSTVYHSSFHTSMLSWSYRRLHVARSSIGAKAGMELSRLRKVALKAGPTVSHHCPMWGMYRMLGEVRFASTKICRTWHGNFLYIHTHTLIYIHTYSMDIYKNWKSTDKHTHTHISTLQAGKQLPDITFLNMMAHSPITSSWLLSVVHIYPHCPRCKEVGPMNYSLCGSHFGQWSPLKRTHWIWQGCKSRNCL